MPDATPRPGRSTDEVAPTGGPVLQLLSNGLQLWVRQQCQSIESLEVELRGSALNLLRGQLGGASVQARRAQFQSLQIEQVELSSGAIQVQIGNLLKGRPLALEHAFSVRGRISLSGEGLSRSLGQPAWRPLGDSLAETLLGLASLRSVRIEHDVLILAAEGWGRPDPVELKTRLDAVEGTVQISSLDGRLSTRLAMDPQIRIEHAAVEAGLVQLSGTATVVP